MKKLKVYEVFINDRESAFKVNVPAASESEAKKYVEGNGEVVACRLSPVLQDIDLDYLYEILKNNCYGQAEIDVIIRTLEICGLGR